MHPSEYLKDRGSSDSSVVHEPFDPENDSAAVECHAEQSSHLMSTLKISMACWTTTKGSWTPRADVSRPMILLSTSGTKRLCEAEGYDAVFAACLCNYKAQICFLAAHHLQTAVIGTGIRGGFREEDQMCCAWTAQGLMDAGYKPWGKQTEKLVVRWSSASVDACLGRKSVEYLTNTGQLNNLNFILDHVDDMDDAFPLQNGEIMLQQYHDQFEEQDSQVSH